TGAGRPQDWTQALDWLARAAQGGDAGSRTQLALLSALSGRPAIPGAVDPWATARAQISLDAWLNPPPAEVLSQSPHVARIPGFLHPAVCDWLIERVRPRLAPARVYDAEAGGRRTHEMRSNTGAGFGLLDTDLILALVRARAAAAAGVPAAVLEPTNVLHYEVGQTFEPHFDFVDPDVAHFADDLRLRGQRTTTLLVYLNDDFEGGETAFPDAGRSFRGAKGDALIFRNVDADGRPDRSSLHAGTPPTRGEKWLLSQWIRDRAQPIV
ncbi:2OG-Fe(II) oxygenase, partial [Caulobacter sp. 17J65-9]|uniref:prolyl hydroxylase family protein n=1 Tax=Caulobacter sp. 17J65-9 TaxID=2709382 RepID=UPI0013C61369